MRLKRFDFQNSSYAEMLFAVLLNFISYTEFYLYSILSTNCRVKKYCLANTYNTSKSILVGSYLSFCSPCFFCSVCTYMHVLRFDQNTKETSFVTTMY